MTRSRWGERVTWRECVCVCERERERDEEKESETKRERERTFLLNYSHSIFPSFLFINAHLVDLY